MVKRAQTDEPITIALKPLMRERRLTFRALADLTRTHDAASRCHPVACTKGAQRC
jgi:hypothetical protein